MVYRVAFMRGITPHEIDKCYIWQIAALFPDEPEPDELLDPDGEPFTPPPITTERLERFERFAARRRGGSVESDHP